MITIALHPAIAASVLPSVAFTYAILSIDRVATVAEAPRFPDVSEARWRAYRDTLQSLTLGEDLPPVGEPEWPVLFSVHDDVVTKSKIIDVGGIKFRHVLEKKKKKGAKQRPLYNEYRRNMHAKAWARSFLKPFGIDAYPEG